MPAHHQWNNKRSKALFQAVLRLTSQDEVADFFRDLCTLEEIEELSKRWQAAQMLHQGKSYRDIAQRTGLSTTTVTRVAHWLKHGAGGYQLMLQRL